MSNRLSKSVSFNYLAYQNKNKTKAIKTDAVSNKKMFVKRHFRMSHLLLC